MVAFIIKRLILTIIVLVIVSLFAFSLIQIMPGDPAAAALGVDATPEQIRNLRHELWLDRPFIVQYGHWAWNALHGDLGSSLMFKEPIKSVFAQRLPITLYLSLLAFVLSTTLGIGMGIISAIRRGGIIDQFVSLCANIGIAIPVFWLGILGIYLFSYKLGWLPIGGWVSPKQDLLLNLKGSVIPVILLAIPGIAVIARQTRSSILEVIRQDYIRTAWSKGLKEIDVILKHTLKPSLIPVVTLLGLQVRILVGGSVLVEQVCNIPGLGRVLVGAALNKDYLVIEAGVLLIGIVVCLANLLVDISYGWLDPRVRYG